MKNVVKFIALGFTIFLFMGCPPRFDPSVDDTNVLIAIYNANPENTLTWDIRYPENARSWEGVELHRTGEVIKLNLDNKNISVLPPDIGQLTSLQELSIQTNDIEILPVELFDLPFLVKLNLSFANELRNIPREIGRLRRLEVLIIQFGNFNTIPSEMGNIRSLRIIQLNNCFVNAIPASFGNLENLEELYFTANRTNSGNFIVVPSQLGRLRNLRILDLNTDVPDIERFWIPESVCNLELIGSTEIDIYPDRSMCY